MTANFYRSERLVGSLPIVKVLIFLLDPTHLLQNMAYELAAFT